MRLCYGFDQMKKSSETERMKRTPRQTLEWLCTDQTEFWKADGTVNVYALHNALKRWAKEKGETKVPAQSTLARLYKGESLEFDTKTANALSEFFGAPTAVIRGELQWNPEEVWGMDITLAELRLLSQLRLLTTDQRRAVSRLVAEMMPPGSQPTPLLMPPRPTPILPIPQKRSEKH